MPSPPSPPTLRGQRRAAAGALALASLGLGLCCASLLASGRLPPGPAAVAAATATVAVGAVAKALRAPGQWPLTGRGARGCSAVVPAAQRPVDPGREVRLPPDRASPAGGRDGLCLALLLATVLLFVAERRGAGAAAAAAADALAPSAREGYLRGLCWSCVAIVGKPAISAIRKSLAGWKDAIGNAEQVGVTSLVQGLVAGIYCAWCLPPGLMQWPPPWTFWLVMLLSSALNAVIRTGETRAYAVGEMSLCAPFLAFDPVMQLAIGAVVAPAASRTMGWNCDEGLPFTARHTFAVASIAQGMLSLTLQSSPQGSLEGEVGAARRRRLPQLPKGAALIVLNCVLYAFTYRLDAAAIKMASTTFYFSCSRLLMAATCIGGSVALREGGAAPGAKRSAAEQFAPFLRPRVALVVLTVCAMDGFYMLSMYRAVSLISPVFVSAVKRGGGVLVAALLGAVCFGESLSGRRAALLTVAVGVTLLCL